MRTVVDTGAQSAIISRDQLHLVAKTMPAAGHDVPTLVTPSAKVYCRSGSGGSELTITADFTFEVNCAGIRAARKCCSVPTGDKCATTPKQWGHFSTGDRENQALHETPLAITVEPTPTTITPMGWLFLINPS